MVLTSTVGLAKLLENLRLRVYFFNKNRSIEGNIKRNSIGIFYHIYKHLRIF